MSLPVDQKRLENAVALLCNRYFPRSTFRREVLGEAANFIKQQLTEFGYSIFEQRFPEDLPTQRQFVNVYVEVPGVSPEVMVIGAHYDAVDSTPGADDNASAVAGLLEMARLLRCEKPPLTMILVFFANEEAPSFGTEHMGSFQFASLLRQTSRKVFGMISLEMIGYYSDEPGSQTFPLKILKWFYPQTGNFICFASTLKNISLVTKVRRAFRAVSSFPNQTFLGPGIVKGLLNSDHSAFIAQGFKALMVTDTAYYRNTRYHTPYDTPDTLDYAKMAQVIEGLVAMVMTLEKRD